MLDDLKALLEIPVTPKATASHYTSQTRSDSMTSSEQFYANSVMTRYCDAYLVARVTTGFGGIIKAIGIALAVGIFMGGIVVGSAMARMYGSEIQTGLGILGAAFAAVIGATFYLFGILVSAQGQILKATLDGAVNNSPFLTNDQKAQTMSLQAASGSARPAQQNMEQMEAATVEMPAPRPVAPPPPGVEWKCRCGATNAGNIGACPNCKRTALDLNAVM